MKKLTQEQQQDQHQHLDFIELQNNCPLCGGQLEFKVQAQRESFSVREEASCPTCDVLARIKDHKMH